MSYMGINDYTNVLSNYITPIIPESNLNKASSAPEVVDISTKEVAHSVEALEGNHVEPVEAGNTFRVKNVDIHDISLRFNANDDYSYIGRDVDIENLDMQKAVSDMQKDGILKQYQFFVGTAVGL